MNMVSNINFLIYEEIFNYKCLGFWHHSFPVLCVAYEVDQEAKRKMILKHPGLILHC